MTLLSRLLAAVLLVTVLFHAAPVEAAARPSAPRAVKATPLNKAVKVTWSAPASAGTSRINAYAVQRRNSTSAPWVTVKYTGAAVRAWTELGLVNGARFYYRVMARNSSGWGTASPQVSAVPRTVPTAPRALEAVVRPGGLGIYWYAPVSNGFATIDRYLVEWSTDGASWTGSATTTTLPTPTEPFVQQLTIGKRYWLRVRAHNAAGYGPSTGAGPYTVSYTNPSAPQQLTLAWDSVAGKFRLTWQPPLSDGGRALDHYEVEWWNDTTLPPRPSTTYPADATTAVVESYPLDHHIRLRACNSATVCGPWSNEVGPITGPVTGLGATEQVVGVTRTVTVTWSAPANGPADSYDVLRSSDGGVTFELLASTEATQYVDTDTAPSTAYTYRVVPHRGGTGQPRDTTLTTSPDQSLAITETSVQVTEGQETTFEVTLAVAPTSPTEVSISSSDPGAAAPQSPSVTIPAGSTSATVHVDGIQDDDLVDESVTMTAALGSLQDSVTVTVVDGDVQAIDLSSTSTSVVVDQTDTTILVSLDRQPAGPVTVTATADSSPTRVSVAPGELTFGPDDWSVGQPLAITGMAKGTTTITLSSPGLPDRVITVTVDNAP